MWAFGAWLLKAHTHFSGPLSSDRCHLGAGFVHLAFPTQSHLQNACNGPASLSDFEFSLDNNAF